MIRFGFATQVSRSAISLALAAAAIAVAPQARAEEAAEELAAPPPPAAETIVVTADIVYRNRSNEVEPILVYGADYFQRFEPLTVGDALKRVPSAAFLSDVIEADGLRLRGLDPGYTQILVDGERLPGGNADRSFFVDRIPAELIERVEIVRSSSARRSGDAMAGTLNIVLRDGFALDGGFVRLGALSFNDGEVKPAIGAVYGGELATGRVLVGFNTQGRRSPKEKFSWRYGEPPAGPDTFDNREDQTDLRDGTDTSFNLNWSLESESSEVELGLFYVLTDRIEDERSREYDVFSGGSDAPVTGGNLLTDNAQTVLIDTSNLSLRGRYGRDMLGGRVTLRASWARFKDERTDSEEEVDFDRSTPRFTGDLVTTDLRDTERTARLSYARAFGDIGFEAGLDWQEKERDSDIREVRNRFSIDPGSRTSYDTFTSTPRRFSIAYPAPEPATGGVNTISESRLDPWVALDGRFGNVRWEAGLRYEFTDVGITDETVDPAQRSSGTDYGFLLPSASLKWELTDDDRVSVSVARTVRRPSFDFISPALLEAELGDNDLQGNPDLKPETAIGIDVGYERRLGRQGVAGINVFYRSVSDLIEVANTGEEGSEGEGTFVLTPRNTGDGTVFGVELDLSTPLTAVGLEHTGVFLNYSWLDSDVDDFLGSRRFNGQAESVLNAGFVQDIPGWGAAFGATYRLQGDAFSRIVGEEIVTSYGAELEIFLEKRFADRFTVRLVGSNLLDGAKDEVFDKFNTLEEQADRDYDEYEIETETAGPVWQLMVRAAF
jgi:iron complex outermembrane recepter protein